MYQNYNKFHNPLESHLKDQETNNTRESKSRLVAGIFIGFIAGLIVYNLYQNWKLEEELYIYNRSG